MKKNSLLFIILILMSGDFCFAQNLVPNPGFETLLPTLSGQAQIVLADPWYSPGGGTPDVFNSAFTSSTAISCDSVGVPRNAGGFAPASSGNGYAGISVDFNNNYYEYLEVPLTIALQAGDNYRVEMDVLRADCSQYGINDFGVIFSSGPLIQTGSGLINIAPTMEYSAIVNDTANWTHLSLTLPGTGIPFYSPNFGLTFITIGIFRDAATLVKFDSGLQGCSCSNAEGKAYYYIDNVVVKPDNELVIATGDTVICPNESTVLTANANVPFWWSDEFNPNDTLSLNFDYIATPSVTTTYYLHGQTKVDTVTVYVINPPVFDIGPDTTFCESDTVTLNAFAPDAILYTWSTGDTTATTFATDTGTYWVIVDNLGCGVFDSIHYSRLLPNPVVDIGQDSMYCFFDNDTLFLDAGSNAVAYSWIPFGDTTQTIKVLTPAYYQVTVTHANGCKRRAGFEAVEICLPKIFIPSAFTPDGDGLNDVFLPTANNVTGYALRIYSRTGILVFTSKNSAIGWDGKYNGREMPAGVYTYKVTYDGLDSEGERKKGKFIDTVVLIR